MTLNIDDLLTSVRGLKELLVADPELDAEGHYLVPHVVFWRGGREVAHAMARDVDRDQALEAARIGIPAYGADAVAFVSDSFGVTEKWFKERGRTPRPGELQMLWEKGRTDLVGEGLVVVWALRAGGVFVVQVPYVVNHGERTVTWLETSEVLAGDQVSGYVPESLVGFFEEPDLMLVVRDYGLTAEDFGLSDEEARFHADVATTKLLTLRGHAVRMIIHSEWEKEVMEQSLERSRGDLAYVFVHPDGRHEFRQSGQ